jgi:hypothetical protein
MHPENLQNETDDQTHFNQIIKYLTKKSFIITLRNVAYQPLFEQYDDMPEALLQAQLHLLQH